ncbi:cytochrome P450 [Lactarius quietus]|nr:cytochrome P450 [Lactarius quietus]
MRSLIISGSDVVHVDVLGTHMVIVNSTKAAKELFDRRSSIYSDRPALVALNRILGMDWATGFVPYGARWRNLRRGFHAHFNPAASKAYHPLEQRAVHRLLRNLLHMAGQVILAIAYGIDVHPHDDPYVAIAEKALHAVSLASSMGGGLFDLVPWLSFLLGICRRATSSLLLVQADGTAKSSVAASLTMQLNDKSTADDIWLAKNLPGNMYLGGADTTACALQTFFLAMALYPEAQRAAHAEIDADKLPFVGAVLKEVFRWHPVAPLGIPHRVTKDDTYEGYLIPAGSMVIGNAGAMLHDPATFPEPSHFKPERWLAPGAPVFPDVVFGFGRRECSGRYMARESISALEDDPPKKMYVSGIVAYPEPFKCVVRPRSEALVALVRATANDS